MKPKNPTRNTKCITCNSKLGDLKAINCQLCVQWACLPCTGVSTGLYDFCRDNDEAMAFLCKDCKLEIPSLREMKSIKLKQSEIETELSSVQRDVAETNKTIVEMGETQTLQGQEITRHEDELKDVFNRLKALESAVTTEAVEGTEATEEQSWASRVARTKSKDQIKTIVRTEINEQAEIEKLRLNLIISGMKETNSDEVDKAAVLSLIEQELHITADISKTERIGKQRPQKTGEDPPPPRLIKLQFVTQRSRKEVLAKVTDLRKSTDEHTKKLVYIRPDLTKAQLELSKNLRSQLKTTRDNNPGKIFKIHKNQIVDITPAQQPAVPATVEIDT